MKNRRNLSKEINYKEFPDTTNALDISVDRIKSIVNYKIFSASLERKEHIMKSNKKIAIIAIAATLVMGITVFAARSVSQWFSSSSGIPDYKTIPTEEQVVKDIGYEVVIIDEFTNGYKFDDGSIVDNNLKNENGDLIEKFKSVTFRYVKDTDKVIFSQDKTTSSVENDGDVIANVDGIDILYHSYTNKFVPGNYKLTEEDKKAEENGELVFSYGTDEVQVVEVQSVSWKVGDIHYQLMQLDGKLSPEELAEMAKELIKK